MNMELFFASWLNKCIMLFWNTIFKFNCDMYMVSGLSIWNGKKGWCGQRGMTILNNCCVSIVSASVLIIRSSKWLVSSRDYALSSYPLHEPFNWIFTKAILWGNHYCSVHIVFFSSWWHFLPNPLPFLFFFIYNLQQKLNIDGSHLLFYSFVFLLLVWNVENVN